MFDILKLFDAGLFFPHEHKGTCYCDAQYWHRGLSPKLETKPERMERSGV
jgi:hypothetical protein